MKKITVNKADDVAAIVEKFLREPDPEIVLVIPKSAKIKETPRSFNLLKREAEAAGRRVSVESVDEDILALAEASGLYNEHPLFRAGGKSLSDILPSGGKQQSLGDQKHKHKVTLNVHVDEEDETRREDAEDKFFSGLKEERAEEDLETDWEEESPPPRRRSWRKLAILVLLVIVLGGGYWMLGRYFAHAQVEIRFAQTPWEFSGGVSAAKSAAKIDLAGRVIPAEVFVDRRNLTQLFPATGKAVVNQKATGKIKIYNAYSSEKQTLVATTRFQTADGKIFRLDSQVLVPGAQIKDGKIIPASIEVNVTADKSGPDYNVQPSSDKLTIPGFKGTPKYSGFYGLVEQAIAGGFNGERAVPTDADIKSAQDRMAGILRSSLSNNLTAGQSKDFKILDEASSINIVRMTVKKETNDSGQFSVFGEAESRAIGFREEALKELLNQMAAVDFEKNGANGTSFRSLELDYSEVQADYGSGQVKFNLAAKGTRATAFDKAELIGELSGQTVDRGREIILALPGLNEANLKIYPRWFLGQKTIPAGSSRIKISSD